MSIATLEDLERRVTALEAAPSDADSLQPNVLSLNPDGSIGATLSGLIKALGIILPAAQTVPAQNNSIEWTDSWGTPPGDIAAQIYAKTGADLELLANSTTSGKAAALGLTAQDNTFHQAGQVSLALQAVASSLGQHARAVLNATDDYATYHSATLFDGLGQSSFLQLTTLARLQMQALILTNIGFVGGSGVTTYSLPTAFAHNHLYDVISVSGPNTNNVLFSAGPNGLTQVIVGYNAAIGGQSLVVLAFGN